MKLAIIIIIFPFLLVLTSILLSTTHALSGPNRAEFNPIRLVSDHLMRGVSGHLRDAVSHRHRLRNDEDGVAMIWDEKSWRFVVETNSLRNWKVVPIACVEYVREYMTPPASSPGDFSQYMWDLVQLITSVGDHLENQLIPNRTDNDVFVFDVSETLLSNLPYYERPDVYFGSKRFNSTSFLEWVKQGEAPAVPAMKILYDTLIHIGYKVVLITGSSEELRGVLEANLKKAGYHSWFKFFLKDDQGISTKEFKSKIRTQLVEQEGYNIVGNIGDQWRDLTGAHAGAHTFKVPNPMYYLP